jgi:lysophospholipase L1-like esterase
MAEAWIAWRDPGRLSRDASGDEGLHFYRFHPQVGLFHKPGFSGEHGGVVYVTNSRGLRGPETEIARVPGRARVVLLGDSLVWGFGVPEGETLSDAIASARPDVDVLNFGVAGFGTGQELILLEAEALAYTPDRVILVFTLANDVEDSYYPDSAQSYPANIFHLVDGRLQIDRFTLSPLARAGLWLRHNSYVVAASFSKHLSDPGYLAHPDLESRHLARRGGLLTPNPLSYYKVELVKQLILAMAETTREAGAELTVVLAPFRAQLAPDPVLRANPLAVELSRFLEAEGIDHLDLLPVLLGSGASADQIFVDGMHLSAVGNRIAGEKIAEAWIPADPYDLQNDDLRVDPDGPQPRD